MPYIDQSGRRQIRLCKLNISILLSMTWTIASLDAWKLRLLPIQVTPRIHTGGWGRVWTMPLCHGVEHSWPPGWHGQTVVDVGDGKSLMASRYFGSDSIVVSDNLKPAKFTSLCANWNLSGFSTMPAWPTQVSKSMVLHQCCSKSVS